MLLVLALAWGVLDVRAERRAAGKYAFATIHYEGTPNDDAYVLGVRVLLKSLQGSAYPTLVLTSSNVRQSSRQAFEQEGAIVVPVRF